MPSKIAPPSASLRATDLLQSIHDTPAGLSLAELLALHLGIARRTAQRWLEQAGAPWRWVWGAAVSVVWCGPATAGSRQRAVGKQRWLSRCHSFVRRQPRCVGLCRSASGGAQAGGLPTRLSSVLPTQRGRVLARAAAPPVAQHGPHRAGRCARGTHSCAILNRLLIDLSWASSQLEGNTYSRLDTRALIEHGQAAQGKAASETQMILNHKSAIELLVENVQSADRDGGPAVAGLDCYTLMNLHAALSENLLPNPADEGRVRQHTVIPHSSPRGKCQSKADCARR